MGATPKRKGDLKMKIVVNFSGTLYKVKEDTFHDEKTNKDIIYYKAIIDQDDGVASVSITKEAVERVKDNLMKDYLYLAEFDTERKTFRVVGASPWDSQKGK